jgi:hypothetical protein
MNWRRRLKSDEKVLKALVDQLGETQKSGLPAERYRAEQRLGAKLAEMNAYVEDCLSGRSDHEKSVLRYKLRVEYPFFSHLASLSSLSRDYVEWSWA